MPAQATSAVDAQSASHFKMGLVVAFNLGLAGFRAVMLMFVIVSSG